MSEEENTVQKKPGPKKGISREEFEQFKEENEKLRSGINEALALIKSMPKIQADSSGVKVIQPQTVTDDAGPQAESMVPPVWRKLTDEILGTDIRLEFELPENGGQRFSVYIPQIKSNAGKDHWDRNHQDKRSVELGNTGVTGVKNWLLKIRKNLVTSGIKLPYYEDPTSQGGISTR